MTRRELLSLLLSTPLAGKAADFLDGFRVDHFTAAGRTKTFYGIGDGPPVLFLHELPGLLREAFAFARRLHHDTGFSVYLPLFFGSPGQNSKLRVALQTPCWGSEFDCKARHSQGQIVDWVERFCLKINDDRGKKGMAVIGNCLTGAMPLALMARPSLRKVLKCAVVSQPAVPLGAFGMPKDLGGQRSVGLTDVELRKAIDSEIPVLAQKFDHDPVVPEARMTFLKEQFEAHQEARGQFQYHHFPHDAHCSSPPPSSGHNHAVLTLGYCDDPDSNGRKAYENVRDFITPHLRGGRP